MLAVINSMCAIIKLANLEVQMKHTKSFHGSS